MILAAGAGTRFGSRSKMLAELGGRPLLEHAIRAQCLVPEVERVVLVLGAHAPEVLSSVELLRAEPVVCEEWESGLSASLRCGLAEVGDASAVIVTLGDEPLITSEVIARFVTEPPGTRAVYDGRPGHPVVLGREHIRALAALGGDRGARDLLPAGRTIECRGLCSDRDVDTPEDLESIRDEARAVL